MAPLNLILPIALAGSLLSVIGYHYYGLYSQISELKSKVVAVEKELVDCKYSILLQNKALDEQKAINHQYTVMQKSLRESIANEYTGMTATKDCSTDLNTILNITRKQRGY